MSETDHVLFDSGSHHPASVNLGRVCNYSLCIDPCTGEVCYMKELAYLPGNYVKLSSPIAHSSLFSGSYKIDTTKYKMVESPDLSGIYHRVKEN